MIIALLEAKRRRQEIGGDQQIYKTTTIMLLVILFIFVISQVTIGVTAFISGLTDSGDRNFFYFLIYSKVKSLYIYQHQLQKESFQDCKERLHSKKYFHVPYLLYFMITVEVLIPRTQVSKRGLILQKFLRLFLLLIFIIVFIIRGI